MADIGDVGQTFAAGFAKFYDPTSAAKVQQQGLANQFRLHSLMLQQQAAQRAVESGQREEARLKIEQTRLGMEQTSKFLGYLDKARTIAETSPGQAVVYLNTVWRVNGVEVGPELKEFFKTFTAARTPEERASIDQAILPILEEAKLNPENFANKEFRDAYAKDPLGTAVKLFELREKQGEARMRQATSGIVAEALKDIPGADPSALTEPTPSTQRQDPSDAAIDEAIRFGEPEVDFGPELEKMFVGQAADDVLKTKAAVRGLGVNQDRASFNRNFAKAMKVAEAFNFSDNTKLGNALVRAAEAQKKLFLAQPAQVRETARIKEEEQTKATLIRARKKGEIEAEQKVTQDRITGPQAIAVGRPDLAGKRRLDVLKDEQLNVPSDQTTVKALQDVRIAMRGITKQSSRVITMLNETPEAAGLVGTGARVLNTIRPVVKGAINVVRLVSPQLGKAVEDAWRQQTDEDKKIFRTVTNDMDQHTRDLSKIALNNARLRSIGVNLVFMVGAAQGQSMRSMSDQDREAFTQQIGIRLNDPALVKGVLRMITLSLTDQLQDRFEVITNKPFVGDPSTALTLSFDDLDTRTLKDIWSTVVDPRGIGRSLLSDSRQAELADILEDRLMGGALQGGDF